MSVLDEYRELSEREKATGRGVQMSLAAIAELEAENARLRESLTAAQNARRAFEDALAEAQARADNLYHKRLPCREAEVAQARYEQAEAENERLRVCGTCGNTDDPDTCVLCGGIAEQHDACHFTPSRWTPYWETDQ